MQTAYSTSLSFKESCTRCLPTHVRSSATETLSFCEVNMRLFWFYVSLYGCYRITLSLHVPEDRSVVYMPGDVIIGGLFPIHEKVSSKEKPFPIECSDVSMIMLLGAQAMIYAINKINKSPELLPGVVIGYKIQDTCGDPSVATRATLKLLEQSDGDPKMCPLLQHSPGSEGVKAVIGESSSEVSAVVARLLAVPMVAQISYFSTSELLSSKLKFPSFLRTVPSDKHQTMAMAKFVNKQQWDIVGVIGSDDEYGKYGSETLLDHFNLMGTCIAFKEILPADFTENGALRREKLDEIFKKMKDNPTDAVVVFTKESNVRAILEEALKRGVRRTWIASDSWSTMTDICKQDNVKNIGKVIGFISQRKEIPGFKEYVRQLISQEKNKEGSFLLNYISQNPLCPHALAEDHSGSCALYDNGSEQKCLHWQCLENYIDEKYLYSIYLAVNVIGHALNSYLKCDHDRCRQNTTFPAWELLQEIQKVNTTVDNTTHIFFDENGDPSTGQEILEWKIEGSKVNIASIGVYETSGAVMLYSKIATDASLIPNCSKSCKPGYELVQMENSTCCKTCQPCEDKSFSEGGPGCKPCPSDQYASPQRDSCLDKDISFLEWTDGLSIALAMFDGLGVVLTVLVTLLFAVHRNTPVVKAAGGYLCFLCLLSLLACFASVIVSLAKPSEVTCKVTLPLFLLAFTLCTACVLANLLQIFVGFSFRVELLASTLKRLNKPAMVLCVSVGLQAVLCMVWFITEPPGKNTLHDSEKHITIACSNGNWIVCVAMFMYICLLSIVCFLFAYGGRKLPDLYKNARYVTVSMLVYLVVCVLFLPFYLNSVSKYRQGIQAASLLTSTYSLLICHFAPKCFIILCRKNINNESAIAEYIREHYQKKNINVVSH
ncbi:hypothetical protein ACEWY4_005201 [Coilia grayii]|uniref:G-protein coupled receptors family 3 profile domain-containing protein n=1 Tax=Coilia grayii TaxID=363190 RepID=A0ABD1KI95_9TELE